MQQQIKLSDVFKAVDDGLLDLDMPGFIFGASEDAMIACSSVKTVSNDWELIHRLLPEAITALHQALREKDTEAWGILAEWYAKRAEQERSARMGKALSEFLAEKGDHE